MNAQFGNADSKLIRNANIDDIQKIVFHEYDHTSTPLTDDGKSLKWQYVVTNAILKILLRTEIGSVFLVIPATNFIG